MVYKCCIVECKTDSAGGMSHFPKFANAPDEDLNSIWVRFVNRKHWTPTKYSRICLEHFDERYIKQGKIKRYLNMTLKPVPTIHKDTVSPPSLLASVSRPRMPPRRCVFVAGKEGQQVNRKH